MRALTGPDIGGVCYPDLIGLCHSEFTLQPIGRGGRGYADFVTWSLVTTHRAQLGLAHQASHALLPAPNAILKQIAMHAGTAVNAVAVLERLFDVEQQGFIGRGSIRFGFDLPGAVPAALNAQHPAHAAQTKLSVVLGHEFVLHPDSLAKYVAAFFRMSRSSFARLNSALSRTISTRMAAVSPMPMP